ncbi:MAG: hypothetical protein HZB39_11260 [Planctomycetes bacterium]|nr:hypothetical protein [Planctomycetota bacterium]
MRSPRTHVDVLSAVDDPDRAARAGAAREMQRVDAVVEARAIPVLRNHGEAVGLGAEHIAARAQPHERIVVRTGELDPAAVEDPPHGEHLAAEVIDFAPESGARSTMPGRNATK